MIVLLPALKSILTFLHLKAQMIGLLRKLLLLIIIIVLSGNPTAQIEEKMNILDGWMDVSESNSLPLIFMLN